MSVTIETDDFVFSAPAGYKTHFLDEEAEMLGPNEELLVLGYYDLEPDSDQPEIERFAESINQAMLDAANEPDLKVVEPLSKSQTEQGLTLCKLLAEADDKSHFFYQYALLNHTKVVMVTHEGDFEDRLAADEIEQAITQISFCN